jgi:hypothetical protein
MSQRVVQVNDSGAAIFVLPHICENFPVGHIGINVSESMSSHRGRMASMKIVQGALPDHIGLLVYLLIVLHRLGKARTHRCIAECHDSNTE